MYFDDSKLIRFDHGDSCTMGPVQSASPGPELELTLIVSRNETVLYSAFFYLVFDLIGLELARAVAA